MPDTMARRQHLVDYTSAAREIELAAVAVKVLEGMRSAEALKAIALLRRCQSRQLSLLDAAAANLGAPYPS